MHSFHTELSWHPGYIRTTKNGEKLVCDVRFSKSCDISTVLLSYEGLILYFKHKPLRWMKVTCNKPEVHLSVWIAAVWRNPASHLGWLNMV